MSSHTVDGARYLVDRQVPVRSGFPKEMAGPGPTGRLARSLPIFVELVTDPVVGVNRMRMNGGVCVYSSYMPWHRGWGFCRNPGYGNEFVIMWGAM